MKDEADRRGRELKDSGKRYWDPKNGKYSGHKDQFFNEVQNFFTSYADDGLNQRLGESVKTLVTDLFMDSEGNLKYKPELWRVRCRSSCFSQSPRADSGCATQDIRSVILPTLFQSIGYIPVPRCALISP